MEISLFQLEVSTFLDGMSIVFLKMLVEVMHLTIADIVLHLSQHVSLQDWLMRWRKCGCLAAFICDEWPAADHGSDFLIRATAGGLSAWSGSSSNMHAVVLCKSYAQLSLS